MNTANNIPSPGVPVVGPDGRLSQVWFQFFVTLFSRTGGTAGQDTAAMQNTLTVAVADIAGLQTQTSQGAPQPDISALQALILAVEAIAQQALATAGQKPDEHGEAGDGAAVSHLAARLAELEGQIEQYRADDALRLRIADLEVKVEAMGAQAPAPAGYDTTTINGTPRLIAYY